ncbi:hypothetical protein ACOT81_12985 [Streptomyces sp. WI04-05B]|uniref:hypothetical protein n=1 Tax=Streptomyces TaxID=1883 RepID=UPI0029B99B7B|nr:MULTISPECIES: hypothetical protein [unclassified Streptomyces]MDX2545355.1 hypothetical protein [Streptomyces sp. WI04-05B]MDX2588150.1 hypothetical protein [Streptomyces sp. WI04-05A]MDX3749089.1 hypothetical protein [Streptomyces sp. AK08-02]
MSWPSVVLLASASECAAIEARVRSLGVEKDPLSDGDFLHWNGNSFALDFSGDVLSDFEPEEVEDMGRRIGEDPRAIYVSCQSMEAARLFLSSALRGFSGLIDTNHGDVVEFAEFVDLIEKHPQWDWRRTELAELLGRPGEA